MGVEKAIENLKPKQKRLFENIISLFVIVTILYAVISCIPYGSNWMGFLASSNFITVTISLVFLAIAWKMIKGGTITIPEQKKGETKFNIPDTWGVRGQGLGLSSKPKAEIKPKQKPNLRIKKEFLGSWECPECHNLAIGKKCRCGYEIK